MNLHIKNMVCERCKMIVKKELNNLEVHFGTVELGEVEVMEELTTEQIESLNTGLKKSGLELISDKKSILVEGIKTTIIELVHYTDDQIKMNLSDFLSEKLNHNYTYLANIFSGVKSTTIEQFYISHKIEKTKELLVYDDLNLTEIARKLHYSSVAHLSYQFKKKTGLTPSQFKNLKNKNRIPLGNV